ncbi:MAG TPA: nucleotidyltransferase family protein [Magnetospirillum sp.]|nr:nucleotidyltransferase family protein [Magnetospirillum sp.]
MTHPVRQLRDVFAFSWSADGQFIEIRPTGGPAARGGRGGLELFQCLGADALPTRRNARDHERFVALTLQNPVIRVILSRMNQLGVDDCWLASGCLFQTVWNLRCGKAPTAGIRDYDLIYFDADTSWDAENAVIQRAARLFADVDARIELRNQARVHLWYEAKFGRRFGSLTHSCHSLWRYPSRTSAVAMRIHPAGHIELYAPFGIRHALDLKVRPNRRADIADVYDSKARRWRGEWPALSVEPW